MHSVQHHSEEWRLGFSGICRVAFCNCYKEWLCAMISSSIMLSAILLSYVLQSGILLSSILIRGITKWNFAEWHFADKHLSMLSAVKLSYVIISVSLHWVKLCWVSPCWIMSYVMLNVAVSVHSLAMYIGAHSASSFRLINVCCWLTFDICRRKSQIIFILFPQF
jgi:hypothetical protein